MFDQCTTSLLRIDIKEEIMQTPAKKSHKLRNIIIAIVSSFFLICICLTVVAKLGSKGTPSSSEKPAAQVLPANTAGVQEPTKVPPTETSVPYGNTRENPYPMNTPVDIGGDMEITVLGVERPANAKVAEGNMFNATPEPGSEYMIVSVGVKCNKPSNEKCTFSPFEFKVVGSDGQVQDQASVAGVHSALESFPEFFGGSILGGGMVYLVKESDARTVLFYDPLFTEKLIYFAVH
jgi:hypothetical protein